MATTQERIARVMLRVGIDRPALTNTQNQIDAFNKTLKDLERQKALSKLAQDSARAVSEGKSLRAEMGRLKAELIKVGATEKEIERVVRQFDRLNESAKRAAEQAGKSTGNKLLRSIGTDIRNLPAVPIPGTGISTDVIGKVLNTLGRLNVDLKSLAVSGGLASVTIIGVAVAFQKLVDEPLRAVQSIVTQIIRSRADLQSFLSTATPQDIVDRQRAAQEAVRETSNKIISTIQSLDTAYKNLSGQGSFGEFIARIQTQFRSGPIGDALNDLETYNKELTDQQITLNGLNAVLEENQRLLEQTTFDYAKFKQELVDRDLFNILQTTLNFRKQSARALREQRADLEAEQAALQNVFENQLRLGISGEAVTKITDRLHDIGIELNLLNDALPQKERIEQAQEAFKKLKESIGDFVKDTAKNFKDLQEATKDIGELKSDFKERITEIQNRLTEALTEAVRDRDIALSEAQRDADMARTEAVREAGLERVEIERDSQLAAQRILRRSKFDINQAIQDRDAVALDAARARRDEELAAEDSNRAERLRKLDIELREQLRTIDMRLKEQNRTIDMRYQEQVRRAALAAQKSIEVETAKYNKELALKVQEVQRILSLEQQKIAATISGATQAFGITATFWQNMVLAARNAVNALNNSAAKVVRPSGSPSGSSGGKIPTMDTGGKILTNGLIFAHAGEHIVNPRRQGQGQGNIVFAPQINGMTKTQVRRETIRQLDQFIEDNF